MKSTFSNSPDPSVQDVLVVTIILVPRVTNYHPHLLKTLGNIHQQVAPAGTLVIKIGIENKPTFLCWSLASLLRPRLSPINGSTKSTRPQEPTPKEEEGEDKRLGALGEVGN